MNRDVPATRPGPRFRRCWPSPPLSALSAFLACDQYRKEV